MPGRMMTRSRAKNTPKKTISTPKKSSMPSRRSSISRIRKPSVPKQSTRPKPSSMKTSTKKIALFPKKSSKAKTPSFRDIKKGTKRPSRISTPKRVLLKKQQKVKPSSQDNVEEMQIFDEIERIQDQRKTPSKAISINDRNPNTKMSEEIVDKVTPSKEQLIEEWDAMIEEMSNEDNDDKKEIVEILDVDDDEDDTTRVLQPRLGLKKVHKEEQESQDCVIGILQDVSLRKRPLPSILESQQSELNANQSRWSQKAIPNLDNVQSKIIDGGFREDYQDEVDDNDDDDDDFIDRLGLEIPIPVKRLVVDPGIVKSTVPVQVSIDPKLSIFQKKVSDQKEVEKVKEQTPKKSLEKSEEGIQIEQEIENDQDLQVQEEEIEVQEEEEEQIKEKIPEPMVQEPKIVSPDKQPKNIEEEITFSPEKKKPRAKISIKKSQPPQHHKTKTSPRRSDIIKTLMFQLNKNPVQLLNEFKTSTCQNLEYNISSEIIENKPIYGCRVILNKKPINKVIRSNKTNHSSIPNPKQKPAQSKKPKQQHLQKLQTF